PLHDALPIYDRGHRHRRTDHRCDRQRLDADGSESVPDTDRHRTRADRGHLDQPQGPVDRGPRRAPDEADMTGVRTVTGTVPSSELGLTLTHEHLHNDVRPAVPPPSDTDLAWLRDADTSADIAWLLREHQYSCLDHCTLDDPRPVADDLAAFAAAGGGTVVDVTPPGLGRDPRVLRRLSEQTGVRIVMGSGWYLERFHPSDLSTRDTEELAASLVEEFRSGVDDTGVAPGVIGEIGVSPAFTPAERHALRAAALAQLELGVPLYVHLPGWQ